METKFCKTCDVEKELIFFPRSKNSDKYYYYPNCKDCSRVSRQKTCNQYYKKNKSKILSDAKNRHLSSKQNFLNGIDLIRVQKL